MAEKKQKESSPPPQQLEKTMDLAEGEEETVDESLREHERKGDLPPAKERD